MQRRPCGAARRHATTMGGGGVSRGRCDRRLPTQRARGGCFCGSRGALRRVIAPDNIVVHPPLPLGERRGRRGRRQPGSADPVPRWASVDAWGDALRSRRALVGAGPSGARRRLRALPGRRQLDRAGDRPLCIAHALVRSDRHRVSGLVIAARSGGLAGQLPAESGGGVVDGLGGLPAAGRKLGRETAARAPGLPADPRSPALDR